MACRRSPAGDPPTGPRHRWKPRCRTSRAGTWVPWRRRPGGRGSGVPWCWRPGGWGSRVPWHWRPGCLLVVPHCLVAPTRRQRHRLDHHACDPPDGTLRRMLSGHAETRWPLSKHLETVVRCGSALGCSLWYRRAVNPPIFNVLSKGLSGMLTNTNRRPVRNLVNFPSLFLIFSFIREDLNTHPSLTNAVSMSFPATEIGMSEIHTFVTGTSSPLPPLTMKGLLSYTCTVFCLRVRLSATCFWRFWWENTHATVLVFPGPQVSFPSRSLLPLL